MTKRELIDEILCLNLSAEPEFLAKFEREDLQAYLGKLREAARAETRSVCRTRRSPGLLEARRAHDPRSAPRTEPDARPDVPEAASRSPELPASGLAGAGGCPVPRPLDEPASSWQGQWDDGEPDLPLFESAGSRSAK